MDAVSRHQILAEALVGNLEKLAPPRVRADALASAGNAKVVGDRAALARLKRCAGRRLAECPEVYPIFYRLLPAEALGRDREHEACFLIATLFPNAPDRSDRDLGEALRVLTSAHPEQASGIERRLSVLLDSSTSDLPFRLRQVIRLLAGKEIGISWRKLLVDVLEWEWESRPVQKRWARSYFGQAARGDAVIGAGVAGGGAPVPQTPSAASRATDGG